MNNKYSGVIIVVRDSARKTVVIGKKKKKPGHFLSSKWHIPGGKLKEGEDILMCAKRECNEELGLTGIDFEFLADAELAIGEITSINAVMVADVDQFSVQIKPGSDLDTAKFFSYSEVKKTHDQKTMEQWPSELKKLLFQEYS